jgi:hypothetical protein
MKENFWNTYPVLGALALAGAATALIFNGFYLYSAMHDASAPSLLKYQIRIGAALVGWIIGCGIVSRSRHGSWGRGILCGLFFIPGLLALIFTTGRKTRQEIWQEANPGLVGKEVRRQYRNVKPLY